MPSPWPSLIPGWPTPHLYVDVSEAPQTEPGKRNFPLGSVPAEPIPSPAQPRAVRGKPIQYRPGQSNDLLLDPPLFSHSSHSIHQRIVLAPPSEYMQNTATLTPTASIPVQSSVTSPRPAHARRCSLSALSPAISFQLKLDHVLSCSKASHLSLLTYRKALAYVSSENAEA